VPESPILHDLAALRRKTAPGLIADRARTSPAGVAFRSKHLGLYRERTWSGYAALVARAARGLAALGLARGDRIAIMADPCEEWIVLDQGAQALGAIVYGIYPTSSPAEVEYQMRDGGAKVFVAGSQEHVDKILPIAARCPGLAHVVVIDTTAMFAYPDPRLRAYDEVMVPGADGAGADAAAVGMLEDLARALDPAAPAFIVYTSGTTGHPKGALVSHGRHLAACHTFVTHYPTLARDAHRTVAYLPLGHVLGRDVAITLPLLSRVVPHFGERREELAATLFEVAPTLLVTVPRYLQKLAAQTLVGIGASSPVKRAVYDWAMRIGRARARRRWEGTPPGARDLAYAAARAIAFRPLLNKLGLDALQLVLSGGAALPPETMALWQIWGVNVVELYGQTEEAGGLVSGQPGPFPRPGDVGRAAEGVRIRLDASGEILVQMADVFDGYWRNDAATREVLGADGWIRTGDIGEWVDGDESRLRLVDRARDFIVTAGGKTLSPAYVEGILRASPYVAEAVVFGHNRKYLTALVEIDFDTVADWARAHGIVYTGFSSLAANPAVTGLLQGEIDRANRELARVESIKAFRILPKALDPEEEGEPVTATRKVKRGLMYERFGTLVESMYDDREERLVAGGAGDVLG